MIPAIVNERSVWILPYAHNWESAPTTTFELLTEVDAGLSNREHRRSMSATLRTSAKYLSTLLTAESGALLAAVKAHDNRPVLCPAWPLETSFGERATAPATGGLRIWFERDWSAYQIDDDSAANPGGFTGGARTAPLLWCRFGKLPESEALNGGGDIDSAFELVENGPSQFALEPRAVALDYGAPVGGVATPLLPGTLVHWSKPTGGAEIRIERERIGYGREESEDYVDQKPRRTQKLTVRCLSTDEIAKLLRLFADRRGSVGAWWCPAFHSTAPADRLLVRFKASKLTLIWTTPTQAEATIEVIALPTEETLPAGETIGTTIGDLGAPCWLYVVTDGDLTWRYTSYESAIDAGALGVFEHRPIQQGKRTSELNLERHDMELTVSWWEGSPFERLKLDRLAPKLTVQVYRGRIAAPAAAALIFTGTVTGPRFEGGKCTCKLSGMSALFAGRGPVAVTSPRCWAPLFSAPCGIIEAAHDAPAQLAGSGQGSLFFEPAGGGGWPATVSDHYRYGYAERTLADGSKRRHRIVGSSPVITDGYTSPLRTGLVEWWDFPETGAEVRYGQANGTGLGQWSTNIPSPIPVEMRRRAPGVVHSPSSPGSLSTAWGAPALPIGGQMSLACWFRHGGEWETNYDGPILAWSFAEIAIKTGGIVRGSYVSSVPASITLPDAAAWVLIGLSVDIAAGTATLYVSGASAVGVAGGIPFDYHGETRCRMWEHSIYSSAFGGVDQAIIWNRALSTEDFDLLYNYGLGLTYADTATPGDQLVVRTLGEINPTPAAYPEAGWRLVPGCDKSFARCKALGNAADFRGFPRFPKSNPALIPIKQETPAGGKK